MIPCAVLILILVAHNGLVLGRETFFFRDVSTTHLPAFRAFARLGLARWIPFASFDQPYLGNPNLLVAYPFPKGAAWVSIHVLVHLAIAFFGVLYLLRAEKVSINAAFFGALTFVFSGYVLSAASTLNALSTIAWIPWVVVVALRPRFTWWGVATLAMFLLSGEPVLIAIALLLAVVRASIADEGRSCVARFLGMLTSAALLTAPVHLETLRAALQSYRVVHGYAYEDASAGSLHIARLAEVVAPFIFGRPDRLVGGAFWGFAATWGHPPYVYCISVSLTALALLPAQRRLRYREKTFWTTTTILALTCALLGRSPMASWLYQHVHLLHSVRFPVKFVLFATLGVSILAAHSLDEFVVRRAQSRYGSLAVVAAMLFALGLAVAAAPERARLALQWWGWDPAWKSDPRLVLGPVAAALPGHLFSAAAILVVVAWSLTRRRGGIRVVALQLLCLAEGLGLAAVLLPTVESNLYRERSSLVAAAASVHGRVYERAAKDLDCVRLGLLGSYPADDVRELAVAQATQGWSLGASSAGVRYAFDQTPDGSYTERNERVRSLVERLPWAQRVRLLRAEGVAGLIIPPLQFPPQDLRELAREDKIGVPTSLYAFVAPMPEVRPVMSALFASSEEQALELMSSVSFDPLASVVIEPGAAARPLPSLIGRDTVIKATVAAEHAGWVEVATSFSPYMSATVSGRQATVYPANVHMVAVRIPAGTSYVIVIK